MVSDFLMYIAPLYMPFGNFIAVLLALLARDFKNPDRNYLDLRRSDSLAVWFKTVLLWPYVLIRFTCEYIQDLLGSVKRRKK